MKSYFKFLSAYYRLNKMQLIGPSLTLIIICGILFGSITANDVINQQTDSYFYDQYGKVSQIIRVKNEPRSQGEVVEEINGQQMTAYLQQNGVFEKDQVVTFINFYGVDSSFFKTFPFDERYQLKDGQAMISQAFAKVKQLKVGDQLKLKLSGNILTYEIGVIAKGDFFLKEDSQGANVLVNAAEFRKDTGLSVSAITTIAGTDLVLEKNKQNYQLDSVRENVSAIAQAQLIQLVVLMIDVIIVLVSTYILFGFYRMAFIGKLHYFSILSIIGIQKKRLVMLMWLENLIIMTGIYTVIALISYVLMPINLVFYLLIYGVLFGTIVLANSFITRLFYKTDVLAYVLGREETQVKSSWLALIILAIVTIGACLLRPTMTTFIIVAISLSIAGGWRQIATKKSSLKLIKHLNHQRIVTEMKTIMVVALVSLLVIYSAVAGVQLFITSVYDNWKFDEQVTVTQEKSTDVNTYLTGLETNFGSFLWKNYSLDTIKVTYPGTVLGIDDLIGINNEEDLRWFNIKGTFDTKALEKGRKLYLDEYYQAFNLSSRLKIEGQDYEILGYFDSSMSATDRVAIVSETSFRLLNKEPISQFYLADSSGIVTDLYGEFGDGILGTMNAAQQRKDNISFTDNLQNILMIFVLFIGLISVLSLLNSFFILRDKQKKLFAVLAVSGLTKKKLLTLNTWQIIAIGVQGLLLAEVILIIVLAFFDWFVQQVIGQNIRFNVTYDMQFQSIAVYVLVFLIVWLANRHNLRKMDELQTIRER